MKAGLQLDLITTRGAYKSSITILKMVSQTALTVEIQLLLLITLYHVLSELNQDLALVAPGHLARQLSF